MVETSIPILRRWQPFSSKYVIGQADVLNDKLLHNTIMENFLVDSVLFPKQAYYTFSRSKLMTFGLKHLVCSLRDRDMFKNSSDISNKLPFCSENFFLSHIHHSKMMGKIPKFSSFQLLPSHGTWYSYRILTTRKP